ncbi:MCM9 [Symbiodinium necroappetens]|uniref:MCM9 protein n=1 Tax=Symbiodinium necroappetens TaxID=1628268 RepID=A0A812ITL8_9DINO|nr:MCM9 [Symbiodinium necroappetens]
MPGSPKFEPHFAEWGKEFVAGGLAVVMGVPLMDFAKWVGNLKPGRIVYSSPNACPHWDLLLRLNWSVVILSFVVSKHDEISPEQLFRRYRRSVGEKSWWGKRVRTISYILIGDRLGFELENLFASTSQKCVEIPGGCAVPGGTGDPGAPAGTRRKVDSLLDDAVDDEMEDEEEEEEMPEVDHTVTANPDLLCIEETEKCDFMVRPDTEILLCKAPDCLERLLGPMAGAVLGHRASFDREISQEVSGDLQREVARRRAELNRARWSQDKGKLAVRQPLPTASDKQLTFNAEALRSILDHIGAHTSKMLHMAEEIGSDSEDNSALGSCVSSVVPLPALGPIKVPDSGDRDKGEADDTSESRSSSSLSSQTASSLSQQSQSLLLNPALALGQRRRSSVAEEQEEVDIEENPPARRRASLHWAELRQSAKIMLMASRIRKVSRIAAAFAVPKTVPEEVIPDVDLETDARAGEEQGSAGIASFPVEDAAEVATAVHFSEDTQEPQRTEKRQLWRPPTPHPIQSAEGDTTWKFGHEVSGKEKVAASMVLSAWSTFSKWWADTTDRVVLSSPFMRRKQLRWMLSILNIWILFDFSLGVHWHLGRTVLLTAWALQFCIALVSLLGVLAPECFQRYVVAVEIGTAACLSVMFVHLCLSSLVNVYTGISWQQYTVAMMVLKMHPAAIVTTSLGYLYIWARPKTIKLEFYGPLDSYVRRLLLFDIFQMLISAWYCVDFTNNVIAVRDGTMFDNELVDVTGDANGLLSSSRSFPCWRRAFHWYRRSVHAAFTSSSIWQRHPFFPWVCAATILGNHLVILELVFESVDPRAQWRIGPDPKMCTKGQLIHYYSLLLLGTLLLGFVLTLIFRGLSRHVLSRDLHLAALIMMPCFMNIVLLHFPRSYACPYSQMELDRLATPTLHLAMLQAIFVMTLSKIHSVVAIGTSFVLATVTASYAGAVVRGYSGDSVFLFVIVGFQILVHIADHWDSVSAVWASLERTQANAAGVLRCREWQRDTSVDVELRSFRDPLAAARRTNPALQRAFQESLEAPRQRVLKFDWLGWDEPKKLFETDLRAGAMEQQTISVAKPGLTCRLRARCSVVAAQSWAADPDGASLIQLTGLPAPLLSRFDLILGLRGARTGDEELAEAILGAGDPAAEGQALRFQTLKDFVAAAQESVLRDSPDDNARALLETYYQKLRGPGLERSGEVSVTARSLESLIRLSRAHARLMRRHGAVQLQDAVAVVFLHQVCWRSHSPDSSQVLLSESSFGPLCPAHIRRLDMSSDITSGTDYEVVEGAVLWSLGLEKAPFVSQRTSCPCLLPWPPLAVPHLHNIIMDNEVQIGDPSPSDVQAAAGALAAHAELTAEESDDYLQAAQTLARHLAAEPDASDLVAAALLRQALGTEVVNPDTDLNAVSAALATHMAEACSSPEHLETVAAALAQHLLKQEVEVPVEGLADVVAKALLTHAAMHCAGDQPEETGFSMEGEATPARITSDPARLLRIHAALRQELMQGIRIGDTVQIRSALNRGASLSAHYYSTRMPARPSVPLHGTPKGPTTSLVNPVDWAVLEGRYKEAMFLLELTDGHMVFNRDEERSCLQVVQMAQRSKQAVVVASQRGQASLLQMLLERSADVAQQNLWGETALHVAARAGQEEVVSLLLQHGAWQKEPRKREVLTHAEAQRMQQVIVAAGVSADYTESILDRQLPGYQEVLQALSETTCKADHDFTVSAILDLAGASRARSTVSAVVEAAPRVERPTWGPAATVLEVRRERLELHGDLVKAVRKGDLFAVASLVQRGAQLDLSFNLGYGEAGNCIDWAVCCERPLVALKLLELATEQSAKLGEALAGNARAALFWSVVHGYADVLEALLIRGIDVAVKQPAVLAGHGGSTPLALAVASYRPGEASLLLKHGAWEKEPPEKRLELLRKVRLRGGAMAAAFAAAGVGFDAAS